MNETVTKICEGKWDWDGCGATYQVPADSALRFSLYCHDCRRGRKTNKMIEEEGGGDPFA